MAPAGTSWRTRTIRTAAHAVLVLLLGPLALATLGCGDAACPGVARAQPAEACPEQPDHLPAAAPSPDAQAGPSPAPPEEAMPPQQAPDPAAPEGKHPKMESQLAETASAARTAGDAAALAVAEARGLAVVNGAVRVVIESATPDRSAARAAVVAAGGIVEAEYADLIQALLPPSALETVAASPDVRYVRAPARAVPNRAP